MPKKQTKADLERHIDELKLFGDNILESLEVMCTDPVIIAYCEAIRQPLPGYRLAMSRISLMKLYAKEWDEKIGDLQQLGLVGPFSEEGDIDYCTTSEPITEWYDE